MIAVLVIKRAYVREWLTERIQKQPPQAFCEKGVLRNLAVFPGKHLCWSLFLIKDYKGPQACNFIKKRLQHRCFPVNIAKFLRGPILKNICERLLLRIH